MTGGDIPTFYKLWNRSTVDSGNWIHTEEKNFFVGGMIRIMTNKNVAIWGIGKCMKDFYPKLKMEYNIVCFVDNDKTKCGKKIGEYAIPCICPTEIRLFDIEIVIITIYDPKQVLAVKKQLVELDIKGINIKDILIDINVKEEKKYLDQKKYFSKATYYNRPDEKIAKVICLNLPTEICNFRCSYCYMFQYYDEEVFSNGNKRMTHMPQYIAYALRRERLGGSCFIDVCASGETLLVEGIVDLIYFLLREGHVIRIVTNLTITNIIEQLLNLPDNLSKNILFAVSLHYTELKKRSLLKIFFENLEKIKMSEASLAVNLVGSDIYIPYIDEIKNQFMRTIGILPQIDMPRDDSDNTDSELLTNESEESFIKIWSSFNSLKFEHRKEYFQKKITGKCMAGMKYFYINVFTGDIQPCVQSKEVIGNLYEDLDCDISKKCSEYCPVQWCINSIYVIPFGMVDNEKDDCGFGDIYNRIDKNGEGTIKGHLLNFLNQKMNT